MNRKLEQSTLTSQEVLFVEFMKNSERKSVYKQIEDHVKKAQTLAQKELERRRQRLQTKLEHEDKLYQEEFAENVKSRIDEHIMKRKNNLIKIKEERDLRDKEFLQQMKIKRELEDCYEIREALTRRDMLQIKETQLEQITEKQRGFLRQRQNDEYWKKVCDTHAKHYEKQWEEEQRLLKNMQSHKARGLDEQIAMHQRERELEFQRKRQEAEELAKQLQELSLEKCKLPVPLKTQAYRKELLDMIAENKAKRDAEKCERIEEHRKLMREIANEQWYHSAALVQRKCAVYKATMEYIEYARRLHKLEEDAQSARYARMDDLQHVDICTKGHLAEEVERKAELAKHHYAELRRQMCEEYKRRLRETQELREQKIIENCFVHSDKSKAEIIAERGKVREELERQSNENARLHAEEEEKYNKQLELVSDDRNFCKKLAEQYIAEQKDHLPTHPNWFIYLCSNNKAAGKCSSAETQVMCKSKAKPEQGGACIEPCGCHACSPTYCMAHNYLSPFKRGPTAE